MASSFRWLVLTALCLSHASGFGIADSFHLMHDAMTTMAHHHASHHHAAAAAGASGFNIADWMQHAAATMTHEASHHVAGASSSSWMQNAAATMGHQAFHHAHHAVASHHEGMNLLTAYKQSLAEHPLPTKMVTGASLAVAGDAIAQLREPAAKYDTRRACSFAVFDMAYRALQHKAFPFIVQHCHGQFLAAALASIPLLHDKLDHTYMAAMEQTLASQLGIVPFLYYPAFFGLTGAVQGLLASESLTRAKDNFVPLMQRNLLFWIPVQFVQFGFIQEDLQIPFLCVCGLAWTFILSVAAGSAKNYSPEEDLVLSSDTAAVEEEMLVFQQDNYEEVFEVNQAMGIEEDVIAGEGVAMEPSVEFV